MDYVENFEFTNSAKRKLLITIVVGIVLFAIGLLGISSDGAKSLFDPASGHGSHHASAIESSDLFVEHSEGHKSSEHADSHHGFHWSKRIKAVLWHNNIYFIGISVIGIFFYACLLYTSPSPRDA